MKDSRKIPGRGDTSSAEQKQAEEKLAKEQAMLNAIIDLNPLPIQVFDGEGHHFKANRAFIEMFASVPPPDYCWFDDPISAQAGFHDEHLKVKEGEVVKHDALWYNPRWLNPNFPDKLTCFRSSVFPILMNPAGKTERFVVMFEDITQQKQAEETLRAERDFNAALVEASPAFLATIGGDGRIRSMNRAMLQALGYTLEEVAGKDYLTTVVSEAERPLLAGIFARLTELKEPTLNENHVLAKDGRSILVEWHGRPIFKPNGEFDYFFGFGLDITERKQAEEAIEAEQQRSQTILEAATVPMIILRLSDNTVLYANEALAKIENTDLKTLIGSRAADYFANPADQNKVAELLQQQGRVSDLEIQLRRGDGSLYWVLLSARIINYQNDLCVLSSYVDISDRKQVEIELNRQVSILDNSRDFTAAVDMQGVHIYVNLAGARMLGYDDSRELIGKRVKDMHSPEDTLRVEQEGIPTAMRAGIWRGENRLLRLDGTSLPVDQSIFVIRDAQGQPQAIATIMVDITERKRAEERLRLFQALADNAGDAIVIADLEGKVAYANRAEYELLGYDYEQRELDGVPMSALAPEQERARQAEVVGQMMATGGSWSAESIVARKDGSIRDVAITSFPVFDEHDRPASIGTFLRDITERKQAEGRLKTIFENAPEAIVVIDLTTGLFTESNENAVKLYGLSHEELVKVGPADMSPPVQPDGRLSTEKALEKINAARQGEAPVFEWIHRNARGEDVPCEVRLVRLPGHLPLVRASVTDITERKRMEDALREVNAKVQAVLDAATQEAIIATDPDGVITVFNTGAERMLGYSAEELVGKQTPAILHLEPEVVARGQELSAEFGRPIEGFDVFVEYARQGRYEERNWTYVRKDGAHLTVRLTVTALRDSAGNIIGFLGMARDITERKQAEEIIRKNEARLKEAEEVGNVGSWDYDMTTDTLIWSDHTYRIYGRDPGTFEVTFNNVVAHYPPGDKEAVLEAFQKSIQNRTELTIEHRIITGNNETRFVLERGRVTYSEDGTPLRMIGSVADITERKQAEAIVQESRARFQGLVETLSDWIWEVDPNGAYTYVSPKVKDLLGYEPEEVLGKTPFDLMPPEEAQRVVGVFGPLLSTQQPLVALENTNRHKDGHLVVFETNGTPFFDADGNFKGYQGADHDITRRKLADAKLRQAQAVVESSPVVLFRWKAAAGWPVELVSENIAQFGYAPEELLSGATPFASMVYPEDLERVGREVSEYSASGVDRFQQEYRIVTKDGQVRWTDDQTVIERDDRGNITHYQGTVVDITERKQAEEELRVSETTLKSVFDNMQDAFYRTDVEGRFSWMSPSTAKMMGYDSIDDLIGKGVAETIYAVPQAREQFLQALREKGRVTDYEVTLKRRDSSHLIASTNSTFYYDAANQIAGVEGVFRDITERKQADQALQSSRQDLRTIFDSVYDAIFIHDLNGSILDVNEQMLKIYRVAREQALNYSIIEDYSAPQDRLADLPQTWQEVIDGKIAIFNWKSRRPNDGSLFDTEVVLRKINMEGREAILANVRDITERKRLEREIQEAFERRGYQVQVSTEISQEVAAASELSDLFGRVVTLTQERLGYYHTQIFRYDPMQDAMVLIDGYGETGKKMLAEGYKLPMGSSLIGAAAASGETILRPTLAEDPDWLPNPLLPDTQGEIAVPIKFQDKVLGVLDVQSNQAGALTEDDRLLLEGLCGQIAITIENVRLSEQSSAALREVDALNRRLTGEGWKTYLQRQSSRQVIWAGDDETLAPDALNAADEQLSSGQIVIEPVAGDEQQATVSVPVMLRGQAIGALRIAMPQAAYTDELHNTLDSIASHLAQAAENARLIEQTQHTAQREKQIAQAADKIHRASDLGSILRTAVEEVSRIVGIEDVGIQLGKRPLG